MPVISNNNLSSPNRFERDDIGYLHSSTMQELSMDDNIGVENDQDEITLEKQLANNNLLPPPARRGVTNLSSLPETDVETSDSGQIELNSMMLQMVKEDLDKEVNQEPERNIQINRKLFYFVLNLTFILHRKRVQENQKQ